MWIRYVMNLPEMAHVATRPAHLVNTLARVRRARVVTCTARTRELRGVRDQSGLVASRSSRTAASLTLTDLGPGTHACIGCKFFKNNTIMNMMCKGKHSLLLFLSPTVLVKDNCQVLFKSRRLILKFEAQFTAI